MSSTNTPKSDNTTNTNVKSNKSTEGTSSSNTDEDDLSYATMYRITAGLPQHELRLMANEARECEEALRKEIRILEEAAGLPISAFPPGMMDDGQGDEEGKKDDGGGGTEKVVIGGDRLEKGDGLDTGAANGGLGSGSGTVKEDDPPSGTSSSSATNSNRSDHNTNESSNNSNNNHHDDDTSIPPNPVSTMPSAYDPANTNGPNYLTSVDAILASKDLTPLDRYFTVSALLGRVRPPFDTPPPPHSSLAIARERATAAVEKKKANANKKNSSDAGGGNGGGADQKQMDRYDRLIRLRIDNEIYTRRNTVVPSSSSAVGGAAGANNNNINTGSGTGTSTTAVNNTTALLALWKRISNHRTAAVFRRAVNAKEAPGYNDRIPFPIDLSLIKKMITCGQIETFEEFHQRIGLICHNCVKFNGRESDYALLTRDFESYVDDSFLDVLQKLKDKAAAASAVGKK